MGKNHKTNTPNTTHPTNTVNTHENKQEPEMTTEEIIVSPMAETGLVVTKTSISTAMASLMPDAPGRKFLNVLPEQYHAALAELRDPTPTDFLTAAQELDPRSRQGFEAWLKKADNKKLGFHVAQAPFAVPSLRIDQGSGKDPQKPSNSVKGCTYDSSGNLVTAPGQLSMSLGVPERFYGAVVAVHGTRQMWPPRDEQGNPIPMPNIKGEIRGNQPLCSSMDRQVGSRWGDCATCHYRPFSTGQARRNECKDEWHFYVVRLDPTGEVLPFSSIYHIAMTSTSVQTGSKPITQRIKGFPTLWDRLFVFETVSQTRGNLSWFQWKASLAVGPGNPAGIPTPANSQQLLEEIARKIDAAMFFPDLARAYITASNGGNEVATSVEENTADVNAVNAAVDSMDPGGSF